MLRAACYDDVECCIFFNDVETYIYGCIFNADMDDGIFEVNDASWRTRHNGASDFEAETKSRSEEVEGTLPDEESHLRQHSFAANLSYDFS